MLRLLLAIGIFIRSEVVNPLLNIHINSMDRGSEGAELDERLNVVSDLIVTKHKNDSFNRTIQAALNRGYELAHPGWNHFR